MSRFVLAGQSRMSIESNTQRKEVVLDVYVGENGYIQNAGYVIQPVAALENGPINGPKAVVLHRTDSTTADGTMRGFERGIGTHFLVGKDGTVFQAASLAQKTAHVGKIRSRCHSEGSCSAEERRLIDRWGWAPRRIHNHEKVKSYPQRYPMNEDSVGIETVAKFDRNTKQWEAPTAEQSVSIAKLIGILKEEYGLSDADIYEHDRISYKEPGEGAGLYDRDAGGDDADSVPARFPPPVF